MSKFLALACAAVGVVGFSATRAEAAPAQTVTALPAVAHVNQVVVVERHHRYYHHGYYRHHRRWYWRHHRRYYY